MVKCVTCGDESVTLTCSEVCFDEYMFKNRHRHRAHQKLERDYLTACREEHRVMTAKDGEWTTELADACSKAIFAYEALIAYERNPSE